MLTANRLRELVNYDPLTGVFLWKKPPQEYRRRMTGTYAGSRETNGYIQIRIDGKLYRAHRLAWLWMNGVWSDLDIDHIDRDTSNNCWSNLRTATMSENLANRGKQSNNTSGFKGVSWAKGSKKWTAEIVCRGNKFRFGLFDDAASAHDAYTAKAKELFGQFARAA